MMVQVSAQVIEAFARIGLGAVGARPVGETVQLRGHGVGPATTVDDGRRGEDSVRSEVGRVGAHAGSKHALRVRHANPEHNQAHDTAASS